MKRWIQQLSFTILTAAAVSGCASIVDGSTQQITIVSTPPGAQIIEKGAVHQVTPATLTVKHKDTPAYTLRKQGYSDAPLVPKKVVNGWVFGNILFGGIIGLIVDGVSGNINKFDQDTYYVTLPPLAPQPVESITRAWAPQQIESFVSGQFDSIVRELYAGDGQHLRTLYAMLAVPVGTEPQMLDRLRRLYAPGITGNVYASLVANNIAAPAATAAPYMPATSEPAAVPAQVAVPPVEQETESKPVKVRRR